MKYYDIVFDKDNGRIILQTEKSLDDISLEDYKHYFKEYWEFIAKYELNYKPKIIDKDGILILNLCWACQYIRKMSTQQKYSQCPLKIFRDGECSRQCVEPDTIYYKWAETFDPQIALEIANLEWEDYQDEFIN